MILGDCAAVFDISPSVITAHLKSSNNHEGFIFKSCVPMK